MMISYSIPEGAVVLAKPGHVDGDDKLQPAVPLDPQPATIKADADGVFPFISINGEERQFRPPAPPPTSDQQRAAQIDAKLSSLDGSLDRRWEDLWLTLKSMGATLPVFIKDVLDQKTALRTERAALTL